TARPGRADQSGQGAQGLGARAEAGAVREGTADDRRRQGRQEGAARRLLGGTGPVGGVTHSSPRIRLRQKAGFGGQERGEVKGDTVFLRNPQTPDFALLKQWGWGFHFVSFFRRGPLNVTSAAFYFGPRRVARKNSGHSARHCSASGTPAWSRGIQ